MEGKHIKDLMEAYLEMYAPQEVDEAVKGESPERRKALAAERRAGIKPLSAKEGEKYASHKISQMAYAKRAKMGEELDIFDVVLEFLQVEGYAETLEEAEWMMANVIDEEAIDIILGEEQLNEISNRKVAAIGHRRQANVDRAMDSDEYISGKPGATQKLATSISKLNRFKHLEKKRNKSAMGEEHVNEAQAARENPEKYEREQAKKSAPVRGERTPMPPRGDKRREDFEKWYAKNVR